MGNPRGLPDRNAVARAFGATLRRFRENAAMSQDALAIASEVDRRHLGDIDRGLGNPSLDVIVRVVGPLTSLTKFFEAFEQQLGRELRNNNKSHP